MTDPLMIDVRGSHGTARVTLVGEVVAASAPALARALEAAAAMYSVVTVDCAGVTALQDPGVAVLDLARETLSAREGRLVVEGASGAVGRRLRASGFLVARSEMTIARTEVLTFTDIMSEDEDRAVAEVADRLQKRFPLHSPDVVRETVAEFHHQYDGSRIRDYIPVLVEREARDRLAPARPSTADAAASS
jgi:anti-anti-sigma factor